MEPNLVGARACWAKNLLDRKPAGSITSCTEKTLDASTTKKGDPVGSPFNSGTDQKNQLKVIVDDPYLYRSSFSFAAS